MFNVKLLYMKAFDKWCSRDVYFCEKSQRSVLIVKIGIVKELKPGEGRVACTPENAEKLVKAGNQVMVEHDAGVGSGFYDDAYEAAGATIVTHEECWTADLIVKVKEPDAKEFKFFKEGQVIWGFQHLASSKETVEAMQKQVSQLLVAKQ